MKRFVILCAIVSAALGGWRMTSAQDAPTTDSTEASTVRVAKKVLDLGDDRYLRPVEPTRIDQLGDGFVDENGVYVCDANDDAKKTLGVALKIDLRQTVPTPIVATGWSKAEGVSGARNSNYSLYLDLVYEDGSALWGQTASFPTGDSDWSQARVEIFPEKPVRSLTFYGLFRDRVGKAYFKDLHLFEANLSGEFALFDGVPVEKAVSLSAEAPTAPSFQLRDVAKNGDFIELVATAPSFSRRLSGEIDGIRVSQISENVGRPIVRLENLAEVDRALTFVYSIFVPENIGAATWLDDPRRFRQTESGCEYSKTRSVAEIGAGRLSKYPFGAIYLDASEKDDGSKTSDSQTFRAVLLGLGLDPNAPAFYRVGFNNATRELYCAVDLALTPEKPVAELRFFELNAPFAGAPDEAFRAVLDVYRAAYPEAFVVRAPAQGNWMPFAKISQIPDWQDFGFKFKEGNDEPDWDDENGIVTFRYTEPTTWWQSLPKDSPKTIDAALEAAKQLADKGNIAARALLTSGFRSEDGQYCGLFQDTPWCVGIVWSMNDAPGLSRLAKEGKLDGFSESSETSVSPVAGFDVKWSEELAQKLYGNPAKTLPRTLAEFAAFESTPGLDGEYVDSSEGYVTALLDFDRSHFAGMSTPLVFDAKTKKPAIYRGLISFEYVRKIAEDVRARGKLMMANSTPNQFFWLVPQLDVLGTETNWNWNGNWSPIGDEELIYRRALCGGKPYCFLMNTDFEHFTYEMVEKYMKRALAYGMFPGFFSADAATKHYFQNPELFERDRPLFKKYLPICRQIAEAGWAPKTEARSNDPKIYVERFGNDPEKPRYFTVFNDSKEEKSFEILFSSAVRTLDKRTSVARVARTVAVELTTGEEVRLDNNAISGTLGPEDVRVFEFAPQKTTR